MLKICLIKTLCTGYSKILAGQIGHHPLELTAAKVFVLSNISGLLESPKLCQLHRY